MVCIAMLVFQRVHCTKSWRKQLIINQLWTEMTIQIIQIFDSKTQLSGVWPYFRFFSCLSISCNIPFHPRLWKIISPMISWSGLTMAFPFWDKIMYGFSSWRNPWFFILAFPCCIMFSLDSYGFMFYHEKSITEPFGFSSYWCVLRKEWMGCWDMLGLLIVSQWIIPSFPTKPWLSSTTKHQ